MLIKGETIFVIGPDKRHDSVSGGIGHDVGLAAYRHIADAGGFNQRHALSKITG
jgi:hypothetical protein